MLEAHMLRRMSNSEVVESLLMRAWNSQDILGLAQKLRPKELVSRHVKFSSDHRLSHLGQIGMIKTEKSLWTTRMSLLLMSKTALTSGDKDTIRKSTEPNSHHDRQR